MEWISSFFLILLKDSFRDHYYCVEFLQNISKIGIIGEAYHFEDNLP